MLAIARWDPRWRDTYLFEKPVVLKKGTQLRVEINYYNPSLIASAPAQRIVWGPRLSQELGGMELLLSVPGDTSLNAIEEARAAHFRDLLLKAGRR